MQIIPQEIIRKKREGHELPADELEAFLKAYQNGYIQDSQMSALLMCFFFRKASHKEIMTFTSTLKNSGYVFDWGKDTFRVTDKHSTGGVGDKSSLILLPLAVLEGCLVPMMSGRGLGHTGGTVDKLESMPGTKVRFEADEAKKIVLKTGGAFLGQSSDLAPLDQKIYALRDVTATVESIPLITASILSKKLAEGLGSLILDVKYGDGAFMQKKDESLHLAQTMVDVAKECKLSCMALQTSMNQILGDSAGHRVEVAECLKILRGELNNDTAELSLDLAAHMVKFSYPKRELAEIKKSMHNHLRSGKALEKFIEILLLQGCDIKNLEKPISFWMDAPFKSEIFSNNISNTSVKYIKNIHVRNLGLILIKLGGGRRISTDQIDPSVGFTHVLKIGDRVDSKTPLLMLHARKEDDIRNFAAEIESCFELSDNPCDQDKLVAQTI